MWKDYFHFTKKERKGVLIFFLVIALIYSMKFFISQPSSEEQPAAEDFPQTASPKTEKQAEKRLSPDKTTRKKTRPYKNPTPYKESYTLRNFDPNTADSLTLRSLGLKPYLAKNIVKYRNQGGRFRKPEDLAKIYGLDSSKFEELKPYIQILPVEDRQSAAPATSVTSTTSITPAKSVKYPLGTQVDIATADTAELKKIPHIGISFAQKIVKYRQLLGGYCCVEQIKEVYGMTPELYADILPWLKVSEGQISQLPVNSLSVERLKSHPYLNFYQAKAIVDLRRKRGKLQQMDDLSFLEEFSETDLQRLTPYLSFN
ncbi:MAG: helix-hairpin-helix domain-containing protein [Dysgonamonadaceae bacterium]|jgi:competence ComEA-like helix-hairpin-helix protein|nr:helix-hairpin-helix domain-containing protein [Dysgonamonadaceae bacterium]